MPTPPSLVFQGKSHNPILVRNNPIHNSVISSTPIPYGLPERAVNVEETAHYISNSFDRSIINVVNEEPFDLDFSYHSLPILENGELSSTLLPVSQYLSEPDTVEYLQKDESFVSDDIMDISINMESAQNSTSYKRKLTNTGVKGDAHNQPLLPGGLTVYRSLGLVEEEKKEDDSSIALVSEEAKLMLENSISQESQENLMNHYSTIHSLQPAFAGSVIPDLEMDHSTPLPVIPSILPPTPSFVSSSFMQAMDLKEDSITPTPQSSTIPSTQQEIVPENVPEVQPEVVSEADSQKKKNQFADRVNEYVALQVQKDSNFIQNTNNRNITTAKKESLWGIVDNSDMSHFRSLVPHLAQEFPFELDDFQKRSIVHLERGESVYVCAHTSAGKTVVADYAISLCQQHMTKCIYTSPVKALSNQKYHDFKVKYEDVGIITGDISVNPTASILIMTTEILRELLYNGSDIIRDVEWVVFDEAHYINDADRGVVWEESIILLPDHVNMVFLSATTPNVVDIADWIGRSKSKKVYIMSTQFRPVPLEYNLIYDGKQTCVKDVNNKYYPERIRVLHGNKPTESSKDNSPILPANILRPKKPELENLIRILKKNDDLPCIVFTLGKVLCDTNARMCMNSHLITKKEADYVRFFYMNCIKNLRKEDRELPQVKQLLEILVNGVGVHHSGLLPLLKEIVEMLFAAGFIKLLFATETFAIGVNMPAKSVCFCGSGKFDGIGFRYFLSSEFTQMAGRAGRRGKDTLGRVYMLLDKLPSVSVLMNIIQPTTDAVKSRFKIDYSMIVNILRVQDLSLENMISHSFSEAVRLREIDQNQLTKKKSEMNSILKEIELSLVELGLTNPFEYITMEEQKKQQRNAYFTKILSTHPQKDQVFTKGRYLKALVTFHNLFEDDRVEETICCIQSINGTSYQCYAYLPFDGSSIDEKNIITITPQFNAVVTNKYLRYNSMLLYATSITLSETTAVLGFRSSAVTKQSLFRQNTNVAQFVIAVCQEIGNFYHQAVEMNNPETLLLPSLPKAIEENYQLQYTRQMYKTVYPRVMTYLEIKKKRDLLAEEMSEEKLGLFPELHSRIAVLKNLKYVDENDVVTIKGRSCCFIRSGNELMLIEMLFDNLINDLSPPELAAVLSVMIFEKNDDVVIKNKKLKALADKMKIIAQNLCQMEIQCGMDIDVDTMVASRTHFGFMEVAYNWCKGLSFADIMKSTDLDEGFVVNTLIRTEGVCRKLGDIAYEIGNPDLRYKCEEVSQAMMRDIVFTPSLYLQE